ncbi:MAG: pentapeptide repeat-containing protein [Magnetococcales bacterium]|nr:pentapeptide repeat-containing protein [Magnetococcales bacterium]
MILATFQQLHDLSDLAQRPFLLKLIVARLPDLQQRARTRRAITAGDIYGVVVDEWVRRDSGKHELPPAIITMAMERLAGQMWQDVVATYDRNKLFAWIQKKLPTLLPGAEKADNFLDTLNRLEIKLRTAMFLSRDGAGNFRFAHTSFQEYFLAGYLLAGLERREETVLDLPRLRLEVVGFFLDRLADPGQGRRWAPLLAQILAQILERPYMPRVSENALFLAIAWRRRQPDTAPQPASWQLTGAQLADGDLAGVVLHQAVLERADLFHANLATAQIRGSLRGANLTQLHAPGVDLAGCGLQQATLDGADLAGADLRGVDLADTPLRSVLLQRANLQEVAWNPQLFAMVRLAGAQLPEHFDPDSSPPGGWSFRPPAPPLDGDGFLSTSIQSGHHDSVNCVALSPDGTLLASTGDDRTIRLWDVHRGVLLRTLMAHNDGVWSVVFSPDGTRLASGSEDHTIRLWDAAAGTPLRTLAGHDSWVTSVAFSPDGKRLLSGGRDGMRLWAVASRQLLAILWYEEDSWLVLTPQGYFDGNAGGIARLTFVHNQCAYPASEFTAGLQTLFGENCHLLPT